MAEMWGDIGSAAGRVYTNFVDKNPAAIAEVKKKIKLDDPVLYMALGWLAREGKAQINSDKNLVTVKILK